MYAHNMLHVQNKILILYMQIKTHGFMNFLLSHFYANERKPDNRLMRNRHRNRVVMS